VQASRHNAAEIRADGAAISETRAAAEQQAAEEEEAKWHVARGWVKT
jgi:hypothetical protein